MEFIAAATALDMILGDPGWFPHPVVYIGKLISLLEKWLYAPKGKWRGFLLLFMVLVSVYGFFELVMCLSGLIGIKPYVTVFFLYTALAVKSLGKAGRDVKKALLNGVEDARVKLSWYVGRDTSELDRQAIIRGTVETIAENTIDGVLAPMFYMFLGLIAGAPVQFVFLYKAVNTLDSMVGYKNEKYGDFGYFSAKTDDVLNFIPARIGSVIMLAAGWILGHNLRKGIAVLCRDRMKHKSPNAGCPESTVAGLLDIRLGGPNKYFGKLVVKPYIGDNDRELTEKDITYSVKIMYGAAIMVAVAALMIGVLT